MKEIQTRDVDNGLDKQVKYDFLKRERHPWRSATFSKVAGYSLKLY